MKKEELTALGLTDEQAGKILAINGNDIEHAKAVKDKEIGTLTEERDNLKSRLTAAETTLQGFEGVEPAKVQAEIQRYKQAAEDAEKRYAAQITQWDQQDWLRNKFDEYGVGSPYARKQLAAECMAEGGLPWKDNAFLGFDDYMKAAKSNDTGLYQTAEEKAAAEAASKQKAGAPTFTGPTGEPATGGKKYTPPKIF